jgi:putative hydrolase of the HAD superfamily
VKKIRAITFDAGGTLLYPFPSVGHIYSEVIAAHGVSVEASLLETGFRRAWKEAHSTPRISIDEHSERDWWRNVVRKTLAGHQEPENFDAFFDELWVAFADPARWKLFDGVIETLAEIKKRRYQMALLSNWDHRLRSLIEGLELEKFFDELFISSEVGFEKPDSRIFKMAEKHFKLPSDAFLHVGDSDHHDVNGAKAVGWQWIQITHQPGKGFVNNQISKLVDLLEILPER